MSLLLLRRLVSVSRTKIPLLKIHPVLNLVQPQRFHSSSSRRGQDVFLPVTSTANADLSDPQCWKCERFLTKEEHICPDCDKIQPIAQDRTFFQALSSDATFDVDMARLRHNFLHYQQKVHPDAFTQKEDNERQLALSQSSWINQAYRTLRDPLSRAEYMLHMHGVEIKETERLEQDDPMTLMTVLEAQEQLEEADNEDKVKLLYKENEERIHKTIHQLSHAFKQHDLDTAKTGVIRLRYWTRLRSTIRENDYFSH